MSTMITAKIVKMTETKKMTESTLTFENICDMLSVPKKTLILTHVNPDPDTIGSAFALKYLIRAVGSDARVVCDDVPGKRMMFLLGEQSDVSDDGSFDFERIISADVASEIQLGGLAKYIPQIEFMIDHHEMSEPFAPNYTDFNIGATGEIVYDIGIELIRRSVIEDLPLEFFECVYAAITSDTGSFKYSNVTAKTHLRAADIISRGVDTAEVCHKLFDCHPYSELLAKRLAIENMRWFCDNRICAALFTLDMLAENGLSESDISDSVSVMRSVDGVEIGIMVRQSEKDSTQFKVSSRANGGVDVSAVCAGFGGGGHKKAAGCTITSENETPEAVFEKVVSAFTDALLEYDNTVGAQNE